MNQEFELDSDHHITPETVAILDRVDAMRATRYFWVENGTENAMSEFHWLADCELLMCEIAWGAGVVTATEPPTNAWWPGDGEPNRDARFLCRLCRNYELEPEPHPERREDLACATCTHSKQMHEGPFAHVFASGCAMAWGDKYEALAYGGGHLIHCRCNGYQPQTK